MDLPRECRESLAHRGGVERRVAPRPEHRGEERRLHLPEHDVGVGHGERSAAPIARGPRIRARGVWADAVARAVEVQDRAAAGGDRVDRHHRRAHAHAGDLRLERALELTRVVRDVGRGAAHVEADDALEPGSERRAHRTDDPAGRTGQDRVLALEAVRIGEAAVRLHEEQARAG